MIMGLGKSHRTLPPSWQNGESTDIHIEKPPFSTLSSHGLHERVQQLISDGRHGGYERKLMIYRVCQYWPARSWFLRPESKYKRNIVAENLHEQARGTVISLPAITSDDLLTLVTP